MARAVDTFAAVKLSTRHLPAGKRLDAYREMLHTSVGKFEIEAIGDQFDFSAKAFALPGLGIAHIEGSAIRLERTREMAVTPERDLVLTVVHDGASSRVQRGREVVIKGRGAFLSSTHDPILTLRTAMRLTNYSLLREDLAPFATNLDNSLTTEIPLDCEPIRLLIGYTDLLFMDGAPAPEFRRLAVSHIHDLIALAIGATRDAAEIAKRRGLRAARRAELYARANRLIALRFDSPDLAPDEMAHRLGVSPRLLQKIFAEHGETVMARLWDERVDRAARLLSAPEAADRSITDIAFACGFNDSSHFGRVFGARMGMAPSLWRKQAREEPAIAIEGNGEDYSDD